MATETLRILLIEDNPGDVRLVRESLASGLHLEFELTQFDRVGTACDWLKANACDAVLLDLHLPDAVRLEGLERVLSTAPNTPVVVLTCGDNQALIVAALNGGAQDYLVKEQTNAALLIRGIRFAIERQRYQNEMLRQRMRTEREQQYLRQLGASAGTAITGRMFNQGPIREMLPDAFSGFVARYIDVIRRSFESQTHKVRDNVSEAIRSLGDELGFLKATPRDVIDVHAAAVNLLTDSARHDRTEPLTEEARLIIIELMGYLATFYRKYAIGFTASTATTAPSGAVRGGGRS